VLRADIETAISTLERDGDEHGVAQLLRHMLQRAEQCARDLKDLEDSERIVAKALAYMDAFNCPHPGCTQTDGQPCAYAQCPQRGDQA
jgi:hypothetical protein